MDNFDRYQDILREQLPHAGPAALEPSAVLAELGLDSLNTVTLLVVLEEEFGVQLGDDLLTAETFSTVGSLWAVLADQLEPEPGTRTGVEVEIAVGDVVADDYDDRAIAVIGMAGRFPGANDPDALWRNVRDHRQSLREFTDDELRFSGVEEAMLTDPNYVRRRPTLDDIKGFDAGFFGFSPREAKLADPQQRIFLECAWEAMEHAGYGGPDRRGRVGVFAGANISMYGVDRFALLPESAGIEPIEFMIGNDKDALATMVSYKLNLTGPSVAVQTFCSTSGAAIHLAVQSLRRGECEMAMAGGVCIRVPDKIGYLFQEGGQESPDGFVRTFDADSKGGVFGDGAGIVVLKPLRQAIADRDTVLAVIRGSGMSNDGAVKFSFTAPSVVGQAHAVADALADAGVTGEDISYVEAHGTATELGDPIEVAGLVRAYGPVERKQYCAIGSVKTNVGHLDRAAGVTGLIKLIQSLRHETIPRILHFREPNPEIDFADSPFYPAAEDQAWPRRADRPRLAGLNSLGVGGTNIHVIVQEAPVAARRPASSRRWHVVPVSARSEEAAKGYARAVGSRLSDDLDVDLADVAYTLQSGRAVFPHKRVVVADSVAGAAATLSGAKGTQTLVRADETHGRGVGFLLAGVGEHYAGMVAQLYEREPVFRGHLDECQALLGIDVVTALTTADKGGGGDLARLLGREESAPVAEINRTEVAQPAVFAAEYALARTLMDWGIRPRVMLGYSVGEYVAACLAGVLSLPDALRLVARRAELIAGLPAGGMLAVAATPDTLPDLDGRGLDLAALNGDQVVVAGPTDALDALAGELRTAGVACRRLDTTHAFHSRMLGPVADELTAWVRDNVTLHAPSLPFVSNVTGELATADLVTDPGYWARHMCRTVRFADGMRTALAFPDLTFVEIGAGRSLGAMLRNHPDCGVERWPLIVATLPAASEDNPDDMVLTEALGRLWLTGVTVDWDAYHGVGTAPADRFAPGRVPLPTYPFQRQSYWWDESRPSRRPRAVFDETGGGAKLDELPRLPEADWLQLQVWRQTAPRPAVAATGVDWLVYTDAGLADSTADALAARLRAQGDSVTYVRPGTAYRAGMARTGDRGAFEIRPGNADDTTAMFTALRQDAAVPARVLHLWTLEDATDGATDGATVVRRGLHTLVALARSAQETGAEAWSLDVVTSGSHRLDEDDPVYPTRATVVGPCRMIPVECSGVKARLIDLRAGSPVPTDALYRELRGEAVDRIVALRGARRFVPTYDTVAPADRSDPLAGVRRPFRDGGVYLVTGGLGGIGLAMAERLVEHHAARLVLFGRTPIPPRDTWDAVIADPSASAEVKRRLTALRTLAANGGEYVVVDGDVADVTAVKRAVATAVDRFGRLDGVLHAAGVPGVGLMQFKTNAEMDRVLAPKVGGTAALAEALADVPLDFVALFSSIASATGALGQTDYCAANVYLDAFAVGGLLPHTRVVSIGWGEWTWNGWTAGLAGYEPAVREHLNKFRAEFGITFDEGWRALQRVLGGDHAHVVVSTQNFATMVERSHDFSVDTFQQATEQAREGGDRHPRPNLSTEFVAAQAGPERTVADIWAESLGLDRVGAHDNFFELGGTSLLGIGIVDKVRRALSLDRLPAHVLYQAPTPGALALAATGGKATGTAVDSGAADQRARLERRRDSLRGRRRT